MKKLWARIQQLKLYRANQRYNQVRGNLLSAGIAYYAFFSIFPAVGIAAVVFGFVLRNNPTLLASVGDAINGALPNLVTTSANPKGLITLSTPSLSVLTISGAIAVVSLVLSAAGWIGSFRDGIRASLGATGSPGNFLTDKLRDLGVFVLLGVAFLLSAVLTTVLGAASGWLAEKVGLGDHSFIVTAVGLAVGYVVDVAVLVLMLRVLSGIALPWHVVRQAAMVGGLGLGIVKFFGTQLIASATRSPLLASVALIIGMLFWLNLIARLVLLSACWAYLDVKETEGIGIDAEAAGDLAGAVRSGDTATDGSQPVRHETARLIPPPGATAGVVDPRASRERDRVSVVAGAVLGAAAAVGVVNAVRRLVSR
ncbi:YihY/virulence factor BrkB family protein [Lapillicoccus sp.]|uniref:YihY/virulence factor BrkB family protein n=1 Tax=Lapillicoccus sp. TaxID=1909287 RepID=UPI0027CBD3D7|nr:YihY/virulence factor BrkB family protein [Actinomycetota bacterium]